MKNKIISLILVMVLALGMLASCGGGDTTGAGAGAGAGNGDGTGTGNGTGDGTGTGDAGQIIFEMNQHSNNRELSSEVKRYYAGEESKGETIDEMVEQRNKAAYAAAGVTIKYKYLPDLNDSYKWGQNAKTIYDQSIAGGTSQPDMYCNFAYDMINASVKGAFANLYSKSQDSDEDGKCENYFEFAKDDYNPVITDWFDSEAAGGYFKGYMDSISLSDDKTYCLASDYCTDLVRAFLVVPVNVKLLGQVKLSETQGIVDVNDNNQYDLVDFYDMVWVGNWTYQMLADISSKIYQASSSNSTGASKLGDVLGFAAGVGSGLTSSGLLYTTDVEIIDRDSITYPENNEKLNAVAQALANLFGNNKSNGVCVVTAEDATAIGYSEGDLNAIRSEFAEKNNILFGGIITVGALEYSTYQNMKANGGFGVVPVPLYKSADQFDNNAEGQPPYRTLVHNLARIVGISCMSTEFEQCTHFLNEVSVNSADILNQYYEKTLAEVVSGDAGEYNVQMLNYIRNCVNDCFDKSFDDTVNYHNGGDTTTTTWHNYLMNNKYEATSFGSVYGEMANDKSDVLAEIVTAWGKAPK